MTPLDPDREFALSQVAPDRRSALSALWRLDATLGAVIAGGREPLISQIKLAWWRDSLEKLDRERPPAEPVLQDVAERVVRVSITGAELAALEAAWAVLLSPDSLTAAELDLYAERRGAMLFDMSARLLGAGAYEVAQDGDAWALVDLARHSNKADAEAALAAAAQRSPRRGWPKPLRPLGMLAVLAQRDVERGLDRLEPQGAPPRIARMLRHRITGR